jgi:TonB family protein
MRHLTAAVLLLLSWTVVFAPTAAFAQQEQQEQPESKRKIVNRVIPTYPVLARTMNLRGTVKLLAVVAPNGTAKSIAVRGGHPVLAQSAEDAIHKWRWEPAAHETHELIEVKFDPH